MRVCAARGLDIVHTVSGEEQEVNEEAEPTADPRRARLAIASGAVALLAALVAIVVVTGGSDDPAEITNECIEAWNDDPLVQTQSGVHAFSGHGYRATLATRLDDEGNIVETEDGAESTEVPDARCGVIFAAPQFDFEPGFGVFVLDKGRWVGLATAEKVELNRIEEIQADAVSNPNATLLSNGRLEQGS